MKDVKFFSVDLLLCLCSTQLYAPPRAPSQQWAGLNGPCDLFLNFLYSRAEQQLRIALGSIQSNSSTFSSCMAVQLVRGLLRCAAVDEQAAPLNGASAGSSSSSRLSLTLNAVPRPIIYSSTLLNDLISQYNNESGLTANAKPFPTPTAGYLGQAVQLVLSGEAYAHFTYHLLALYFIASYVSLDRLTSRTAFWAAATLVCRCRCCLRFDDAAIASPVSESHCLSVAFRAP